MLLTCMNRVIYIYRFYIGYHWLHLQKWQLRGSPHHSAPGRGFFHGKKLKNWWSTSLKFTKHLQTDDLMRESSSNDPVRAADLSCLVQGRQLLGCGLLEHALPATWQIWGYPQWSSIWVALSIINHAAIEVPYGTTIYGKPLLAIY